MQASIPIIIVDDELPQAQLLETRIQEHFPSLRICAICASADEATIAVARHAPKLVFLDVEMPGGNGFQFLESLAEINFNVIFTTSHATYATRAFRVAAVDFLLKPFNDEDLRTAVDRFLSRQAQEQLLNVKQLLSNRNEAQMGQQKIALPTSNGFIFARVSDIIRMEAQNTYTTFFLADKNQVVVSRTMKECEEMLRDYGLIRVHQSHMINLGHIKKYTKGEGGTIEMDDGSQIEVSRRKKEEFMEVLKRV